MFFGGDDLDSISFKNGSSAGTVYIRNKQYTNEEVSSTNYEFSLGPGASVNMNRANHGDGIIGPWRAIGSATITLEILPIYKGGKRRR